MRWLRKLFEPPKSVISSTEEMNANRCRRLCDPHDWKIRGRPLTGRTYWECGWCGAKRRRGNDLLPWE